jgi:hypothetical protein
MENTIVIIMITLGLRETDDINQMITIAISGNNGGLVVKAEDSQLCGCGFKLRRRILDGVSKASYYIGERNKGSQMGHTKIFFNKQNKNNSNLFFLSNLV